MNYTYILLTAFIMFVISITIAHASKVPCSGGLPDWYCLDYPIPPNVKNPTHVNVR